MTMDRIEILSFIGRVTDNPLLAWLNPNNLTVNNYSAYPATSWPFDIELDLYEICTQKVNYSNYYGVSLSLPLGLNLEQDPYEIFPKKVMPLDEIYTFRERKNALNYLKDNNYLESSLLEAPAKIKKYFTDAALILEVMHDPEEKDSKHLTLFIKTSLPPAEAIGKLEQFDEEWWIDASYRSKGKLSINLEFE